MNEMLTLDRHTLMYHTPNFFQIERFLRPVLEVRFSFCKGDHKSARYCLSKNYIITVSPKLWRRNPLKASFPHSGILRASGISHNKGLLSSNFLFNLNNKFQLARKMPLCGNQDLGSFSLRIIASAIAIFYKYIRNLIILVTVTKAHIAQCRAPPQSRYHFH